MGGGQKKFVDGFQERGLVKGRLVVMKKKAIFMSLRKSPPSISEKGENNLLRKRVLKTPKGGNPAALTRRLNILDKDAKPTQAKTERGRKGCFYVLKKGKNRLIRGKKVPHWGRKIEVANWGGTLFRSKEKENDGRRRKESRSGGRASDFLKRSRTIARGERSMRKGGGWRRPKMRKRESSSIS